MKTPTHYFVCVSNGNTTKNKLDKSIASYLVSLNGRLVKASCVLKLKEEIVEEIENLNVKHPRCKPFITSFRYSHYSSGYPLNNYHSKHLIIFPAYLAEENNHNNQIKKT